MRRTRFWALGLVLAASVGCSSGVKCVPVSGSVKVNDKPAQGLLVTLVPTAGKDDPSARPGGVVGADGTFELSTYDAATRTAVKGSPPGKYKVILSWIPESRPGDPVNPNPTGKPPGDKLGGRYLDPERSTYEVVVKDGPTKLEPIALTLR